VHGPQRTLGAIKHCAQRSRYSCRRRRDTSIGEAQHPEAQDLEPRITDTVGFEGRAVAVVPEAVSLDDHLPFRSEEIHLELAHLGVHLGPEKPVATAEAQEEALELAAC
jgi:hypothetical protein